jgi:hypothetical protein
MKAHAVGVEFFHVVRRRERERDVSKVIAADRNIGNTPSSDVFWEIDVESKIILK